MTSFCGFLLWFSFSPTLLVSKKSTHIEIGPLVQKLSPKNQTLLEASLWENNAFLWSEFSAQWRNANSVLGMRRTRASKSNSNCAMIFVCVHNQMVRSENSSFESKLFWHVFGPMEVKSETQLFQTSTGSKVMEVKRSNFPMHFNGTFWIKISKCAKIGQVVVFGE